MAQSRHIMQENRLAALLLHRQMFLRKLAQRTLAQIAKKEKCITALFSVIHLTYYLQYSEIKGRHKREEDTTWREDERCYTRSCKCVSNEGRGSC